MSKSELNTWQKEKDGGELRSCEDAGNSSFLKAGQ